jgi:hypothetical protein
MLGKIVEDIQGDKNALPNSSANVDRANFLRPFLIHYFSS